PVALKRPPSSGDVPDAELVPLGVPEDDPPDAVGLAPVGLAVHALFGQGRAEPKQAVDLLLRLPGGEVDVDPVLAGCWILDPEEQDQADAELVGRLQPHEVVAFVDCGVAGHSRPEAAEEPRVPGVEGDVVDERCHSRMLLLAVVPAAASQCAPIRDWSSTPGGGGSPDLAAMRSYAHAVQI